MDVIDMSHRPYTWYSIGHPHEHCPKMPKHVFGWALMTHVSQGRTAGPIYCPWCGEKMFPREEPLSPVVGPACKDCGRVRGLLDGLCDDCTIRKHGGLMPGFRKKEK